MIKVNVSERDLTGCCLVVNWRPGIKGCLASSHNHNKVLRESLCAQMSVCTICLNFEFFTQGKGCFPIIRPVSAFSSGSKSLR